MHKAYENPPEPDICACRTAASATQTLKESYPPLPASLDPIWVSSPQIPLEQALQKECTSLIATQNPNPFDPYLNPNEFTLEDLRDLLKTLPHPSIPSLISAVGTERFLFLLLLADKEFPCAGAVSRDCNPKVKAYLDFVILLIRLSKNREEFVSLANVPQNKEYQINQLSKKITESEIPREMKDYYLKNLETCASIYYGARQDCERDWTQDPRCECVNYWKHDDLFNKLKQFADSGSLVTTTGSINDLSLLQNNATPPFWLVDTSNVQYYCAVDLQGSSRFQPHVIWTVLYPTKTTYHQYHHNAKCSLSFRIRRFFLRHLTPTLVTYLPLAKTLEVLARSFFRRRTKTNHSDESVSPTQRTPKRDSVSAFNGPAWPSRIPF
jgi:hypothetical protein